MALQQVKDAITERANEKGRVTLADVRACFNAEWTEMADQLDDDALRAMCADLLISFLVSEGITREQAEQSVASDRSW